MNEITKRYSNGEITVVWKPGLCSHSTNCFRSLPQVFDPRNRPWVTITGADSAAIVAQVERCPSGALSIQRVDASAAVDVNTAGGANAVPAPHESDEVRIQAAANGPLLVRGEVTVIDAAGNETRHLEKVALCRCGGSSRKPFCDGSHKTNGFQG